MIAGTSNEYIIINGQQNSTIFSALRRSGKITARLETKGNLIAGNGNPGYQVIIPVYKSGSFGQGLKQFTLGAGNFFDTSKSCQMGRGYIGNQAVGRMCQVCQQGYIARLVGTHFQD